MESFLSILFYISFAVICVVAVIKLGKLCNKYPFLLKVFPGLEAFKDWDKQESVSSEFLSLFKDVPDEKPVLVPDEVLQCPNCKTLLLGDEEVCPICNTPLIDIIQEADAQNLSNNIAGTNESSAEPIADVDNLKGE